MMKIFFNISKEDFCRILRQLQAAEDLKRKIDDMIYKETNVETDFLSGYGMCVDHAGAVIELLEKLTLDTSETISWWAWEADYGRDKDMHMWDSNKNLIDLSTPEKLYDHLLEDANARSDN